MAAFCFGRYVRLWLKPTITLDARQFNSALKELFETDKRTCVDFINGQAWAVASAAIKETKKADAAKVASELGQIATAVKLTKSRKTGQARFRRGARVINANLTNTLAARIIGRLWDKGGWKSKQAAALEGKSLEQQIKIFIGWRARAIGFIASGWIPAIRTLASIVRQKPSGLTSVQGTKQLGVAKGKAIPARFQLTSKIEAMIENNALKTTSQLAGGDPMKVATEGLQRAMNRAAADMMEKLAERRQRDFNKVNAK